MKELFLRCLMGGIMFSLCEFTICQFTGSARPFHICAIKGLAVTAILFLIFYAISMYKKKKK